jgi:PAS domain S-box-containing protein
MNGCDTLTAQMANRSSILAALLAHAQLGVVVVDGQRNIITWNHWLERYSGLSESSVLGRELLDIFPELKGSRLQQAVDEALHRGLPAVLSRLFHDSPLPLYSNLATNAPAASLARCKQHISVTPFHDSEGMTLCLIQIADVSAQVAREAALKQQINERRAAEKALADFKTTLDMTVDCVFMFDPQTLRFTYVNQGAIDETGYAEAQLLGMTLLDIEPDLTQAGLARIADPLRAQQEKARYWVTRHKHKSGRLIPVEVVLQYVDPEGQEPRFIAVVRNLSARQELDRMYSEFVSVVSHELRTPLTSIFGALSLLGAGAVQVLTAPAQRLVDLAVSNSERLIALVNDILDLEKLQSGNLKMDMSPQPLMPVVRRALEENASYAQRFRTQFRLVESMDEVWANVDSFRLMQVLTNLLSNAAKFSPADRPVEVSVTRSGNGVRTTVQDHGPGIPEEFRERIFQKFSQAHSGNEPRKSGTGLGLVITKELVERMGGHIGFDSTPGAGAAFYFDLPVVENRQPAEPGEQRATPAATSHGTWDPPKFRECRSD